MTPDDMPRAAPIVRPAVWVSEGAEVTPDERSSLINSPSRSRGHARRPSRLPPPLRFRPGGDLRARTLVRPRRRRAVATLIRLAFALIGHAGTGPDNLRRRGTALTCNSRFWIVNRLMIGSAGSARGVGGFRMGWVRRHDQYQAGHVKRAIERRCCLSLTSPTPQQA